MNLTEYEYLRSPNRCQALWLIPQEKDMPYSTIEFLSLTLYKQEGYIIGTDSRMRATL
jgi:hypothetical protein